jgi:preflagellin peptidase FlaK
MSFCKSVLGDPTEAVVTTAFSLVVAFSLSLILFKMELFGGADAKALIVLSVFIPTLIPILYASPFPLLTPVSTTINLVLLLALVFAANFARNLFGYFRGKRPLRVAHIRRLRKLLLLYAYRRLPSSGQDPRNISHEFLDRSNALPRLVIIDGPSGSGHHKRRDVFDGAPLRPSVAEAWTPLRIPVILLLTVSLLASLLIGDPLILTIR